MTENEISKIVIGAAIRVHQQLGPGLLEKTYQECLFYELEKEGLSVVKEMALPVIYDNVFLDMGYRVDLLVENKVIIELKSVETMHPIYFSQILTYLRLSNKKLGLLINFNTVLLGHGIKRVVNNL